MSDVVAGAFQFVGIVTAATVSIHGWEQSAKKAKQVSDAADLQLIRQVLRYALFAVPNYANLVAKDLSDGRRLNKQNVQSFDLMRRAYDEHWPKVHAIPDENLREDVLSYFLYLQIARQSLDSLIGEGDLVMESPAVKGSIANQVEMWGKLATKGDDLVKRFGFTEPTIR